ncbi:MAG: T9SS type A sorting domain-containing protein [Bacteroidota bacterium]
MKKNSLLCIALLLLLSHAALSQIITTNTTYNGVQNATGNIIILSGATLTLAPGTTLLMPTGSQIRIRDGGRLLVQAGCTLRTLNNSYWEGIRVDPTSISNPATLPAVTMLGTPTNVENNLIDFQDASRALEGTVTSDGQTRLRSFELIGVEFSHCESFILYLSTSIVPDHAIDSKIQDCKFIGDANTMVSPISFTHVDDLEILGNGFTKADPSTIGDFIMFFNSDDILFSRNTIFNDGVGFYAQFNNIDVSNNQIASPESQAINMACNFNCDNVLISFNQVVGNSAASAPAIYGQNISDLRILSNVVFNQQIGISCTKSSGNSFVADNQLSLCSEAGIEINGDNLGGADGDGLFVRCNTIIFSNTGIQLENSAQLPVHLTEWNGFTIETDPGNEFIGNGTDINNDNLNFTWLYYVLDAANSSLNPPTTTGGNINLVDLQNLGRYACDESLLVQTPGGGDAGARAGATQVEPTAASRLFPNPARQAAQLQLSEQWQQQTVTINLIDLSGKVVKQWPAQSYQGAPLRIATQDLPAGHYFCRITATGQQPEMLKLIVVN